MDALTLFGLIAVTADAGFLRTRGRASHFILAFAGACAAGSVYGFLQGAWPFGVIEAIWAYCCLALARSGFQDPSRTEGEDNVLRDDINNALKDAMKAKDERKVSTLRLMNSTIKNADIEARGAGKEPLSDGDLAPCSRR